MITRNSVIYHLLTDRFDNSQGTLERKRAHPGYKNTLRERQGGTFNGLERHIDYLKDLGVSHLMISPVERCENGEYHGYAVTHPGEINPHFGTPQNLRDLTRKLRENDIGTILDYVPLVLSNQSRIFQETLSGKRKRDWFLFREVLNDPRYAEDAQRLAARQDCGESDYFHFFCGEHLPFFNLANEKVVNWHIKRATKLLEEYDFSDIRLDLGFYMPERVIGQFTEELQRRRGEDTSVIIENWPYPLEEFNGGEGYGFCSGEFNMKGTILLNNWGREPHLIDQLRDHFYRAKGKADKGYQFVTGLDNHDLPRFKGYIAEQRMASVLLFTIPHLTPTIYYGNETGMGNEGDDPFGLSRGIMNFSEAGRLYPLYQRLTHWRRAHDFTTAKLHNLQINDTETGSNQEHQLVSYTVETDGGKNAYHIMINREDRAKPVWLNELFHRNSVLPLNLLTQEELHNEGDGRRFIGPRDCCILPDRRNKRRPPNL